MCLFQRGPGFGQKVHQAGSVDLFGHEKRLLLDPEPGVNTIADRVVGLDPVLKQDIGISPFHFSL
jgi:hypothetical protein